MALIQIWTFSRGGGVASCSLTPLTILKTSHPQARGGNIGGGVWSKQKQGRGKERPPGFCPNSPSHGGLKVGQRRTLRHFVLILGGMGVSETTLEHPALDSRVNSLCSQAFTT